jgi:hypothetical protein
VADSLDGAGLEFDPFDSVFTDALRGTGFAFRKFKSAFRGPESTRPWTNDNIDLDDLFEQSPRSEVNGSEYDIVLSEDQALNGIEKELVRNGKRLKVRIPAGVTAGSRIRLRNALKTTDGRQGDITITIKVKWPAARRLNQAQVLFPVQLV